jgi:hypothetical protein
VGFGMFSENAPDFRFASGDAQDLARKLASLVAEPERIAAFFENPPDLPDMAAHWAMVSAAAPLCAPALTLPAPLPAKLGASA